jgi:hypothetical protein
MHGTQQGQQNFKWKTATKVEAFGNGRQQQRLKLLGMENSNKG